MNLNHAVDVYVDSASLKAAVYCRRDRRWWQSDGPVDAYTLGLAVREALDPKSSSHHVAWISDKDEQPIDLEDRYFTVVYRQNHQTLVATPLSPWGKLPIIVLPQSPTYGNLGRAILIEVQRSAEAAESYKKQGADNKET